MREIDKSSGIIFERYVTMAPVALPRSPQVTAAVTGILLTHGAFDLRPHEKSGDIRFKLPETASMSELMHAVSRIHHDFWICSHCSSKTLDARATHRARHESHESRKARISAGTAP